jgi:hypothetical protein
LSEPSGLPWEAPGWSDAVRLWVDEALATAGLGSADEVLPHQARPWAVVLLIRSNRARWFFKAVAPGLGHEVGVHRTLFGRHPDSVPPLVAQDQERGWLLMKDAGQPLRRSITSARQLHLFDKALTGLADLQRQWLDGGGALLAQGALDRRLESLTMAFAALVEDPLALAAGREEAITLQEHSRLVALIPKIEAACETLAACGPPPTLHHDDFHDANIYVQDGGLRYADWGEAGLAHPFFTPMIALRSLAFRLNLSPEAPELAGLRATYLDAWHDFGDPKTLDRAFDLAQRLAAVSRALTWHQVMSAVPAEMRGEDAAAPAEWLRTALTWLEPEPWDTGRD